MIHADEHDEGKPKNNARRTGTRVDTTTTTSDVGPETRDGHDKYGASITATTTTTTTTTSSGTSSTVSEKKEEEEEKKSNEASVSVELASHLKAKLNNILFPDPSNKIDTRCLNTVKFIAIFIIAFCWHYQHFGLPVVNPFVQILPWSFSNGRYMVELFFALSGFGMNLGYTENLCEHKTSFKAFLIKRLQKLYPLHFWTLLTVTFLQMWHIDLTKTTFVYSHLDVVHFIRHLFLVQNGMVGCDYSYNGPSWCISICFMMYIVHFVVCYFSKVKKRVVYSYSFLFFCGFALILNKWNYPFLLNGQFGRGLVSFSYGVLMSNVYKRSSDLRTKLIGYTCLLILVGIYVLFRTDNNIYVGNLQHAFIVAISPVIIFGVIYIPWLNYLLSTKCALFLGSLSFPIYLWHFPTQLFFVIIDTRFKLKIDYTSGRTWVAITTTVVVVAALYVLLLEKLMTKLFLTIVNDFVPPKPAAELPQETHPSQRS